MNKAFEKLMAKKAGDKMPEARMKARSSVLDDLMSNMDDRESNKLGMKKVSVSADSKEGLKEGLDKAKDLVDQAHGDMPEGEESGEDEMLETPEHEAAESPELEEHEHEDELSKEQLMAEIEALKARLEKLGA